MVARRGTLGLGEAKSWLDDLTFALQLQPDATGRLQPGDLWREGRDFAWTRPAGAGYGDAAAPTEQPPRLHRAALQRAAHAVEVVPRAVLNPSKLPPAAHAPAPTLIAPAAVVAPASASAFGGADAGGSAFHRAVQLWSYRGACPDALLAQAVRDTCGEHRLDERAAELRALLARLQATQPGLLGELRTAAARGELFHEVGIGYVDAAGTRVEGSIDLLYRGGDGQWHLLDYKTDRIDGAGTLEQRIADHHAQVAAYAESTRGRLLAGQQLASYGLWFVTAGTVATWAVAAPARSS